MINLIKSLLLSTVFFLLFCPAFAQPARYRTIEIKMGNKSKFHKKAWRSEADSAFKIMNKVFNSHQFQDTLRKLLFIPDNYCYTLAGKPAPNTNITGETTLDSLFKEIAVTWTLIYKLHDHALGETRPGTYLTTAYRNNIKKDMPELSPAYRLAVNLCHEYFHQVNYCHTYDSGGLNENYEIRPGARVDLAVYNRDVTYRVGWIAYFLVLDKVVQIN